MRRLFIFLLAIVACLSADSQRLAILSDIHVTPGNENERQLLKAIDEINADSVDAVLVTGDLTNEGSDEQLRHVKALLDQMTRPYHAIPGNHENNWSQSACGTFVQLWGGDRFVCDLGRLVVIGLNCGPFMKMGDGHVRQDDLHWLDTTLTRLVSPGKYVLSVNHYPILDDLDNYRDYVRILQKYPVITHQSGHYHQWRQYETGGISGVMVRALDMKNGDYGYTLLDIDLDRKWMHVFNKTIGQRPELKYAYKINLDYDSLPRVKVDNHLPPAVLVSRVTSDEASIFTRVSIDEKRIYYGNSLGQIKAIDKKSGREIWHFDTDGMLFSRPAVGKRCIVAPTTDRRLLWIDKRDGKLVFAHTDDGPFVADGLIVEGVLYQGGYKTFQAWDVEHQKLLWRYDSIGNYCQAEPTVEGNDVIFGAWDTNLRCLNRRSGQLRWSWNNGHSATLFSPGNVVPVVNDNKVLIVAPDRAATAIDRQTGQTVWREKNNFRVRESLGHNADNSVAYAKTMDGELVAMSATGESYRLLWSGRAEWDYDHAPCIVLEHRGHILLGSRRGVLAVFDAHTHQNVGTYHLGTSEVNGFDIDPYTGDVFCSLVEGLIFKISI